MADRVEAKRRLRRELFACLRGMPDNEKAKASGRIREVISSQAEFQNSGNVAAFVALPSEPDLGLSVPDCYPERTWCLPRVAGDGSIEMRGFSAGGNLVTGDFKISEPDPASCPLIAEDEIDLILIPGVGFDPKNFARLGRGKGHYDRFLARVRELDSPPPIWGICFARQLIAIDPEPHDQPVNAIITEEEIFR